MANLRIGKIANDLEIGDRVRLKRNSHGEHAPYVQKGATGVLLSVSNVFCQVLIDKQYRVNSANTYMMFSDEIESEAKSNGQNN